MRAGDLPSADRFPEVSCVPKGGAPRAIQRHLQTRKIVNAVLGLVLGAVTLPLCVVIWPLFCACFFCAETDGGLEDSMCE